MATHHWHHGALINLLYPIGDDWEFKIIAIRESNLISNIPGFSGCTDEFYAKLSTLCRSDPYRCKQVKSRTLAGTGIGYCGNTDINFVVGVLVWLLFGWFKMPIPLIHCLLFGALISPTDPIAVLGILKKANIPASLELKISGESLFNDGVAIVIFVSLAEIARSSSGDVSIISIGKLFLIEALGGIAFGLLLGYIGYWALRSIDDYKVEVLITLAIVSGGYFLAGRLHLSGPLAMVIAGIFTGNKSKREGMSDLTRDYLGKFWEMVDEILNAVLFLFIGVEMLIIKINPTVFYIGIISIGIVLFARWVSVYLPVSLMRFTVRFEKHAVKIMTWGGLRGGISVALALSLSSGMHREQFVLITYIIVVFSILVQGLTIGKLAKKLGF